MPLPKFNLSYEDYNSFDNQVTYRLINQTNKTDIKKVDWYIDDVWFSSNLIAAIIRTNVTAHKFQLVVELKNGCKDTILKNSLFVPSGTNDVVISYQISQNPFKEYLNINVNYFKIGNYQILDMKGLTVAKGFISRPNESIHLGFLTAGMYSLKFENCNEIYKIFKTEN
jgi:hypothetical protein